MIQFKRLKTVDNSDFENFYETYMLSFPQHERRNRLGLEHLTQHQDNFICNAIYNDDQFVGLITWWKLMGFTFVEHFAIKQEYRNQKLGISAMKYVLQMIEEPIVLEVEMPKSNDASRRIHFYERLGFYVLSDFYMQPPYHPNDFPTPMLLMSNRYLYCKNHFHSVKDKIYKNVYHFEIS